jgi:hypothetical protein
MRRKKRLSWIIVFSILASCVVIPQIDVNAADLSINVSIDTTQGRTPISPQIYGGNWDFNDARLTGKRLGGNRMTATTGKITFQVPEATGSIPVIHICFQTVMCQRINGLSPVLLLPHSTT